MINESDCDEEQESSHLLTIYENENSSNNNENQTSSSLYRYSSYSSVNSVRYNNKEDGDILAVEVSMMKTISGLAGNALELYDFACFGYFSDIIGDQFFPPNQTGNSALIESFAVFGGAFFMRPIGGAVMGYVGDKYGSQRALEISIFLMAFPTFAMGCLPTYSQVGFLSPVLLLIVRLLQGFSVGGQLMSSLVFTVERHPRKYWGFYGSLVMATANVGTLLGGIMSYIIRYSFSRSQLESFGWRIPFICGICVSFCGFYLKNHEDGVHGSLPPGVNPLKEAFKSENRSALISSSLVPMLWSCGFYITFVWLPIFMKDIEQPPVSSAFGLNNMALFLTNIILFPVAGSLADKFGTSAVMNVAGILMIILSPALVIIIQGGAPLNIFCAQCVLGINLSLWGAPMMSWLVESFPQSIRLTSVSIGYNIAQATVGGMSPGIATYMLDSIGYNSPSFLISITGIISMIGLYLQPKHMQQSSQSI